MVTQQHGKMRLQLVRLAISGLSPLLVYFVIRPHVGNDTEALALAWFIPVAWTLGSSVWQRRLDVFSLLGVVAYGIALAIAIFFGAGALPLKLHHAIVAGAIGLVCLVSVAINKPIFLLFIRRSTEKTDYATQAASALANPLLVKRISSLTLIIGIATLTDAVLQTVLALVLSTSAFLIATTAVHIAAIVGIALGVFLLIWIRSRRQDDIAQSGEKREPML
ncbi:MAG TPA: VC0807 family protein [Ktedonobacteraceae bacterium]|nr:VC0807 family protein [Ktedonobacteraceae bacterium]